MANQVAAQQTAVQSVVALQLDVVAAIWALAPLMIIFMLLNTLSKAVTQALQPETLRAGAELAKAVLPAAAGAVATTALLA